MLTGLQFLWWLHGGNHREKCFTRQCTNTGAPITENVTWSEKGSMRSCADNWHFSSSMHACMNTKSAAGLVKGERLSRKVIPSHTCQVFSSDLCVMPGTETLWWTNPSFTLFYPLWNADANIANQDLFSLQFISALCLQAIFLLLQICTSFDMFLILQSTWFTISCYTPYLYE